MRFKLKLLSTLLISTLTYTLTAQADTSINFISSKYNSHSVSLKNVRQIVKNSFNAASYANIKVQVIYNLNHKPESLLVYLFSKKYHRVDMAKIYLDTQFNATRVIKNYQLTSQDFAQQPGISSVEQAVCPDPSVQFIAFAPNDNDLEQAVTVEVANIAEKQGLKTIRLLKKDATRSNYLNYMACPLLEGNFYDGDANPSMITTVDGVLSANDIAQLLNKDFRYKVTNIWLACEAYNDPLKTTMLSTVQSQKYAAGINNLLVGPSDRAAACAMEAGLNKQPLTSSFQDCYKKLDTPADKWGFGGDGSDYFGA